MLRQWQSECTTHAISKYQTGNRHYFCQGTPGAGKTTLAAEIACRLMMANMIDLVLCFSPSLTVAESIKRTFGNRLKCTFSGSLGAVGQSLTYQSLQHLREEFWLSLKNNRIFVVFDEIHHCSGSSLETANAWGQQILTRIQGHAAYSLALSGTPWRTDLLPIVMAQYMDPEGKLVVDYQYTLQQAIKDNVCRIPKIVLIDNHQLSIQTNQYRPQLFESIKELLEKTKTSYRNIIHNAKAMEHLLGLGCSKLAEIRRSSPNAGGLVVAASVAHAHSIAKMLTEKFQQSVAVVSYLDDEPLNDIEHFKGSQTEWIISVGMVSEGTDIPRLQVCCHLSSIKTELYFRQVLGRILRVTDTSNQEAWLYTFAEPNLVSFAEEIEKDIPESCLFIQDIPSTTGASSEKEVAAMEHLTQRSLGFELADVIDYPKATADNSRFNPAEQGFDELKLGEFKQRVISAFL